MSGSLAGQSEVEKRVVKPLEDEAAAPETSETTTSCTQSMASSNDQTELMLTQLARQLEYYFSFQNLSKDTYVQTLRQLNDGCVPVTVLANFSKVKAIVSSLDEEVLTNAVLRATAEYSDSLKVNSIDTTTGKITTNDTRISATTIRAVGTVDNKPLQLDTDSLKQSTSLGSFHSSTNSLSKTNNTVILRDVDPDVSEDEVRQLFSFENCPSILSLQADVASCW